MILNLSHGRGSPIVENFDPTLAIASIFHNLWLKKSQKKE
jgi:hypothetical protein